MLVSKILTAIIVPQLFNELYMIVMLELLNGLAIDSKEMGLLDLFQLVVMLKKMP